MVRAVLVLGSFVADVSFRAARLPAWGETLMGSSFLLGPGGKGSNQAVAAARAGARVQMLSKVGRDAFGQLARDIWAEAGIDATLVEDSEEPTGAAAILVDQAGGENAIIVVPGACYTMSTQEVQSRAENIARAAVFLAQLELPLNTVKRGLALARGAGVVTILNPAPAPPQALTDEVLSLADFLIPNETEAAILTGRAVESVEQAAAAAAALRARGSRDVIVTLGARGALVCQRSAEPVLVPSFRPGPCVDTTGAGDAFCGAFSAALAEGRSVIEAAHFACAGAGLSVTRPGTARSMPSRAEIEALIQG